MIDATNLHREHRAVFANLARQQNAPLTAVVFEVGERVPAAEREAGRRRAQAPPRGAEALADTQAEHEEPA